MSTIELQTGQGPARLVLDGDPAAATVLLLGHGAGGGVEAPDLAALAARLPRQGVCVARFEQPWRTAGKRVAPAPARLDEAWLGGVAALRDAIRPGASLWLGGRSAGARVACRTSGGLGAAGVLALAFPLHPPGRPEKSRAAELLGAGVPVLVVQGSRDPFGSADEVRAAAAGRAGITVEEVLGAGHELTLPKRSELGTEQRWDQLAGLVTGVLWAAAAE